MLRDSPPAPKSHLQELLKLHGWRASTPCDLPQLQGPRQHLSSFCTQAAQQAATCLSSSMPCTAALAFGLRRPALLLRLRLKLLHKGVLSGRWCIEPLSLRQASECRP